MAQRRRKDDEPEAPEVPDTPGDAEEEVIFTPAPAMIERLNAPEPEPGPARPLRLTTPRYRVAGQCARCGQKVAVLVNAPDLEKRYRDVATVLRACDCLVVAYSPTQVGTAAE